MDRKKIAVAILLFLTLGAATAYKLISSRPAGLTASGTIEITRADIMPKTNGYLQKLSLSVGDRVQAGQVVAALSRADLTAQLLRDEAGLAKAVAQLNDLEKGSRSQELDEAQAAQIAAAAQYTKAHTDLARYRQLFADGAISAQQFDAAVAGDEVAANALRAARAHYSQLAEGNRSDVILAQRLEVERSRAIVAASKAALDDTVINSPLSGIVLSKNFESGEYVNPGAAIATIGDPTDCWVKIYIPSDQLGLLTIGQDVDVRVDSFADRIFPGNIKEISQNAEFTPRQSLTPKERANQVFAVKIRVANADGTLKPGMPADVVLR